jgi:hypothetical protein
LNEEVIFLRRRIIARNLVKATSQTPDFVGFPP